MALFKKNKWLLTGVVSIATIAIVPIAVVACSSTSTPPTTPPTTNNPDQEQFNKDVVISPRGFNHVTPATTTELVAINNTNAIPRLDGKGIKLTLSTTNTNFTVESYSITKINDTSVSVVINGKIGNTDVSTTPVTVSGFAPNFQDLDEAETANAAITINKNAIRPNGKTTTPGIPTAVTDKASTNATFSQTLNQLGIGISGVSATTPSNILINSYSIVEISELNSITFSFSSSYTKNGANINLEVGPTLISGFASPSQIEANTILESLNNFANGTLTTGIRANNYGHNFSSNQINSQTGNFIQSNLNSFITGLPILSNGMTYEITTSNPNLANGTIDMSFKIKYGTKYTQVTAASKNFIVQGFLTQSNLDKYNAIATIGSEQPSLTTQAEAIDKLPNAITLQLPSDIMPPLATNPANQVNNLPAFPFSSFTITKDATTPSDSIVLTLIPQANSGLSSKVITISFQAQDQFINNVQVLPKGFNHVIPSVTTTPVAINNANAVATLKALGINLVLPTDTSGFSIESYSISAINNSDSSINIVINGKIGNTNVATKAITVSGFAENQSDLSQAEAANNQIEISSKAIPISSSQTSAPLIPSPVTNQATTNATIINDLLSKGIKISNLNNDITINSYTISSNSSTSITFSYSSTYTKNGKNINLESSPVTISGFLSINQNNLNKALITVNNLKLSAKDSVLPSTLSNATIEENLNGLPSSIEGVSLTFTNFTSDNKNGSASFNIELTSGDLTATSKLFTVSGFLTTLENNRNIANSSLISLNNLAANTIKANSEGNTLSANSIININNLESFISGLPSLNTGLSYLIKVSNPNLINGSVDMTFQIKYGSESSDVSAVSKEITVSGFLTQVNLNKYSATINNFTNTTLPNLVSTATSIKDLPSYINLDNSASPKLPNNPKDSTNFPFVSFTISNNTNGDNMLSLNLIPPTVSGLENVVIQLSFAKIIATNILNSINNLSPNTLKASAEKGIITSATQVANSSNQEIASFISGLETLPSGLSYVFNITNANITKGTLNLSLEIQYGANTNDKTNTSKEILVSGFLTQSTLDQYSAVATLNASMPSNSASDSQPIISFPASITLEFPKNISPSLSTDVNGALFPFASFSISQEPPVNGKNSPIINLALIPSKASGLQSVNIKVSFAKNLAMQLLQSLNSLGQNGLTITNLGQFKTANQVANTITQSDLLSYIQGLPTINFDGLIFIATATQPNNTSGSVVMSFKISYDNNAETEASINFIVKGFLIQSILNNYSASTNGNFVAPTPTQDQAFSGNIFNATKITLAFNAPKDTVQLPTNWNDINFPFSSYSIVPIQNSTTSVNLILNPVVSSGLNPISIVVSGFATANQVSANNILDSINNLKPNAISPSSVLKSASQINAQNWTQYLAISSLPTLSNHNGLSYIVNFSNANNDNGTLNMTLQVKYGTNDKDITKVSQSFTISGFLSNNELAKYIPVPVTPGTNLPKEVTNSTSPFPTGISLEFPNSTLANGPLGTNWPFSSYSITIQGTEATLELFPPKDSGLKSITFTFKGFNSASNN